MPRELSESDVNAKSGKLVDGQRKGYRADAEERAGRFCDDRVEVLLSRRNCKSNRHALQRIEESTGGS